MTLGGWLSLAARLQRVGEARPPPQKPGNFPSFYRGGVYGTPACDVDVGCVRLKPRQSLTEQLHHSNVHTNLWTPIGSVIFFASDLYRDWLAAYFEEVEQATRVA
jgi:hypothetical protein